MASKNLTSVSEVELNDVTYIFAEAVDGVHKVSSDEFATSDDIAELHNKMPFNFDWVFISGDFMQTIEPYCKSGKHYFVIFQTAGSMTNGGSVPIYGLGTLITNGSDRHNITAHSGGSGSNYHVTGFNNLNSYASTGWVWYNL